MQQRHRVWGNSVDSLYSSIYTKIYIYTEHTRQTFKSGATCVKAKKPQLYIALFPSSLAILPLLLLWQLQKTFSLFFKSSFFLMLPPTASFSYFI